MPTFGSAHYTMLVEHCAWTICADYDTMQTPGPGPSSSWAWADPVTLRGTSDFTRLLAANMADADRLDADDADRLDADDADDALVFDEQWEAVSEATVQQLLGCVSPAPPPPTVRAKCDTCAWRNIMLPEETDSENCDECHTPMALMHLSMRTDINKRMMYDSHEELPPLWKDICCTQKLQAGSHFSMPGDSRWWFRFPLRNMQSMSPTPSSHHQTLTDYVYDREGGRVCSDAQGKFTMYHFTKLINLVQPHENSEGSSGILRDGGMRYGCWHGDGIGVYCNASMPHWTFSEDDGWVMLELRCHPHLTKVKSSRPGAQGRYVIKSDQTDQSLNAHCPDCEVVAMLHLCEHMPQFMKS